MTSGYQQDSPISHSRLGWLILAFLFTVGFAVSAVFIYYRLTSPSDGALLLRGISFSPEGVEIATLDQHAGNLQNGDRVVSVAGRDMETWARSLFDFTAERPLVDMRAQVAYEVLRQGQRVQVEVQLGPLPLASVLAENWNTLIGVFVFQMAGLYLLWRKRGDQAARAYFIVAISMSHVYGWVFSLQIGDITNAAGYWLFRLGPTLLLLLNCGAFLHIGLVFPRPAWVLQRFPMTVFALYVIPFVFYAAFLAVSGLGSANTLEWLARWRLVDFLVAAVSSTFAIGAVIVRYRVAHSAVDRQKIRFFIVGTLLTNGTGAILAFGLPLLLGRQVVDPRAIGLTILGGPIVLAIAILRYRLFDIDIIIRRTLVYSILTALLALVYFGSVVLLQQLFRTLSGEALQTEVPTIVSTLAIAALFAPLRRRIQNVIDRRFYRRKYDAAKTLAAFGATMRDEVDLNKLTERLVQVVEETMQPAYVSLWLRKTDTKARQRIQDETN